MRGPVLKELKHARPPIEVKFFFSLLKQMDGIFSLCEMIKIAQDGNSSLSLRKTSNALVPLF